jgi:hypothetical protein
VGGPESVVYVCSRQSAVEGKARQGKAILKATRGKARNVNCNN